MRAITVERAGGPEVLAVTDAEAPRPGAGELLVEVAAAGVNFRDVYERSGIGVYARPGPFVTGVEGAGTVLDVGPGVDDFGPGDRVAWADALGSYAEQVIVPAARAVPVAGDIDLKVAAAVMLQGMTAHYLCHSTFGVSDGDVAVVLAAAGGVGLLLTQLIKKRGGIVVAVTSTTAKAELARGAGADHVVGYDEFAEAARRVGGGRGANVVFDSVGAATFDDSLTALRPRGMMVLYGGASGQVPLFDLQRLNTGGSLFITRPTLGSYVADRAELLSRAGDLLGWIAAGELDVRIGATYPLADAARAQEDLEARRTTGKLLLLP